MSKKYAPFKPHQIFSINKIAQISGIQKDKLYNTANGNTKNNNLTDQQRQDVKLIITQAMEDYFLILDD